MPMRKPFENSPVAARVAPFGVFLFLTFAQNECGEAARYWIYVLKTLVGAWLIWVTWPQVKEMRAKLSWEAVVVGVGVCVLWVGLDGVCVNLSEGITGLGQKLGWSKPPEHPTPTLPWNPHAQFGDGSGAAWFYIAARILGSSLVVPFLEEVFFRSFLYRYIAKPDFESVSLSTFLPVPFILTAVIFASEHGQYWLSGLLCGFIYHWLVLRKQRLGDAIVAHGITNFLLGVWVVWKGAWQFW